MKNVSFDLVPVMKHVLDGTYSVGGGSSCSWAGSFIDKALFHLFDFDCVPVVGHFGSWCLT